MTAAARRTALIATALLLVGANYWWFTRETPEKQFDVTISLAAPSPCPKNQSQTRALFERPLTFAPQSDAWLDSKGEIVSMRQRLESAAEREWFELYKVVRVRLDHSASYGDALDAMRNLAENGICFASWSGIENQTGVRGVSAKQSPRYDNILLVEEIRHVEGWQLQCIEGMPPLPIYTGEDFGAKLYAHEVNVDEPWPCIIPGLPGE